MILIYQFKRMSDHQLDAGVEGKDNDDRCAGLLHTPHPPPLPLIEDQEEPEGPGGAISQVEMALALHFQAWWGRNREPITPVG